MNKYYCVTIGTYPRTRPLPPADRRKTARRIWNIRISVFRDYHGDNDILVDKCFEEDWKHCRIEKLVKDEGEIIETKAFFKSTETSKS